MSEQPGHAQRDQDETSPQTGGGIEPQEAEDNSGASLADDEDAEREKGGAAE